MLHACEAREDIEAVVARAAAALLPDHPGALLVSAAPDDAPRRRAAWGAEPAGPEVLPAGGCFALKRGRTQSCGPDMPCVAEACGAAGLCIPLTARGEVHGILRLSGLSPAAPEAALARALADTLSLAYANAALRERLRAEALRDPLTGLYNRRFLAEVGPRLEAQARRRAAPLAIVALDLDHFKALNDRHGHAAGDAVLRQLGQVLRGFLRSTDIACRHGGEEFLLLPDCEAAAAAERAEALRLLLERDIGGEGLPGVTASFGVAALPDHAAALAAAIAAADTALYAAKAEGRNRVALAPRQPALALAAE